MKIKGRQGIVRVQCFKISHVCCWGVMQNLCTYSPKKCFDVEGVWHCVWTCKAGMCREGCDWRAGALHRFAISSHKKKSRSNCTSAEIWWGMWFQREPTEQRAFNSQPGTPSFRKFVIFIVSCLQVDLSDSRALHEVNSSKTVKPGQHRPNHKVLRSLYAILIIYTPLHSQVYNQ